ncbi:hypothetical protein [Xanthomonas axonopodis]
MPAQSFGCGDAEGMLRRRYEATLLIQFIDRRARIHLSIYGCCVCARLPCTLLLPLPALVGEFHSAKEQGAVASRNPRLCGLCLQAAWRTGDAQWIEPSAGNALARDPL